MSKSLYTILQISMKELSGKKKLNKLWQHEEKNHPPWLSPL